MMRPRTAPGTGCRQHSGSQQTKRDDGSEGDAADGVQAAVRTVVRLVDARASVSLVGRQCRRELDRKRAHTIASRSCRTSLRRARRLNIAAAKRLRTPRTALPTPVALPPRVACWSLYGQQSNPAIKLWEHVGNKIHAEAVPIYSPPTG
jgi:hypothetical protein